MDEPHGTVEDRVPAAPRRAIQEPPHRLRRRVLTVLGIALALLLVAGAGLAYYGYQIQRALTSNLQHNAELPPDSSRPEPDAPPQDGRHAPVDVVLMGSDSRDLSNPDAGRSDTLMVAHLSGDRQTAYLISFPRDMYVEIPGYGQDKINAAFAYGGTALTVQTVESLLDTRMDHLAVVNFEGFIELTDAVGGITVDNEHAFSSHGYDYPEGPVELSGEKALWYVRERYSLPNGDFDRAENQRKVVQAIVAKGLSPQVIADPAAFTAFVSGIASHTAVDAALTDEVIRETALSLRLDGASDIVLLQAPVLGTDTTASGQSIDVVDFDQLAELGEAMSSDTMDEYVAKYPPE